MSESELHRSAFLGSVEEVRKQLSAGAKIDAVDPSTGDTPLLRAIEADSIEVVTLLLTNGADPNRKGQSGNAPLHRAVDMAVEVANDIYDRSGERVPASLEIIKVLLRSGADPLATDSAGQSPLDWARRVGFNEAMQLLQPRVVTS